MRSLTLSALVSSGLLACESGIETAGALGGAAADSGPIRGGTQQERDASGAAATSGCDFSPGVLASGAGSGRLETLTTGPQVAETLVLDETNAYWLNQVLCVDSCSGPTGQVMQCSKNGCRAPIVLATLEGLGPSGLAVDATGVYWTDNGTLKRVAIGGGQPTTVAAANAGNIALDGTNIYFTSGSSIAKIPIGGSAPTRLVTGLMSPGLIAVDTASVYFTDTVAGTVQKVPLGGGAPTTLAEGQTPSAMALDSSNVYWTNYNNDEPGGTVVRVPISGGNVIVLASGLRTAFGIAVDATNVYWTSNFAVMSMPKEGGCPATLVPANSLVTPMSVAADATSLYWTDFITGALTKLTPK
jgi:hypothetical protein